MERESSQKSHSRSNGSHKKRPKHHQTSIQSTEHHPKRYEIKGNEEERDAEEHEQHRTRSAKKSHTQSRPSTAVTNATRHSSVNQQRGRRRRQNQAMAAQ